MALRAKIIEKAVLWGGNPAAWIINRTSNRVGRAVQRINPKYELGKSRMEAIGPLLDKGLAPEWCESIRDWDHPKDNIVRPWGPCAKDYYYMGKVGRMLGWFLPSRVTSTKERDKGIAKAMATLQSQLPSFKGISFKAEVVTGLFPETRKEIIDVVKQAFPEDQIDLESFTDVHGHKDFKSILVRNNKGFLVGFATGYFSFTETYYLDLIGLSSECRGFGMGKLMTEALMDIAKAMRYKKMRLEALPDDIDKRNLRKFYENLGFHYVGEPSKFGYTLMEKDLV